VVLLIDRARAAGAEAARMDAARRRAERDLREGEDLLQPVTDAVPVLITYIGTDSRYRFVNQTYKRWFGRDPDEVRGRHVRDVLGDATYQAIRPHMERAFAGDVVSYE